MRFLALLMLACGAIPDVAAPGASCPPLEPSDTCCGAVSGLRRCLNGRPYTCEPLPACYDAQECGIGGLKTGRLVFVDTDAGCYE